MSYVIIGLHARSASYYPQNENFPQQFTIIRMQLLGFSGSVTKPFVCKDLLYTWYATAYIPILLVINIVMIMCATSVGYHRDRNYVVCVTVLFLKSAW